MQAHGRTLRLSQKTQGRMDPSPDRAGTPKYKGRLPVGPRYPGGHCAFWCILVFSTHLNTHAKFSSMLISYVQI